MKTLVLHSSKYGIFYIIHICHIQTYNDNTVMMLYYILSLHVLKTLQNIVKFKVLPTYFSEC